MNPTIPKAIFTLLFCSCYLFTPAQQFTKVTDAANPITVDTPTAGYTGTSWVDINNDGHLDLFINQDFLYFNQGDGSFIRVNNSGITGVTNGLNNGHSWGDFDNDGFLDVYLANDQSALFKNNGDNTFSKVTEGDIGSPIDAWATAWADYDGDGFLDLMATHPCGFIGPCHPNWLFRSNGDGTFTEVTDSDVTMGNAAYTVGNWSDFDGDGDMDLFIGSGEVSALSQDHIYINQLVPTGTPDLIRKQDGVLFGDFRDGQNWNWIDYDNDGDLDGFVTNYFGSKANDFYRNDGGGVFVKLNDNDLGSAGLVTATGAWLTNLWGDFDNDGDLDAFATRDGGLDVFYDNNGDGTFSAIDQAMSITGATRGASAGDYDNDGDLDLFVNAAALAQKGLYQNNGNSNNWVNFTLRGTDSNRAAIGAKVRAKVQINGNIVWQMREISSQSSFCGANSLRVHFGLADATIIDSLIIEWPSGLAQVCTDLASNTFHTIEEGNCITLSTRPLPVRNNLSIYPNPTKGIHAHIEGTFDPQASVNIYDQNGRLLKTYAAKALSSGHAIDLPIDDLPNGIYLVKIVSSNLISSGKLVIQQ